MQAFADTVNTIVPAECKQCKDLVGSIKVITDYNNSLEKDLAEANEEIEKLKKELRNIEEAKYIYESAINAFIRQVMPTLHEN